MAWNGNGSSWQYARWVWNIARNMRITNPTGAELTAVRTFVKAIWNPQTQTGTRNWLQDDFLRKAVTGNYSCDIDTEPAWVVVELLGLIGRNLDEVGITNAEKTLADVLIVATGNRRYGTTPYYGGTSGSTVAVP